MKKILALDLGITSLGYAVLEEDEKNSYKFIDNSVLMRKAPYDENGNSAQSSFSTFRSLRKLKQKQKKRIKSIANFFDKFNLISYEKLVDFQNSNLITDKWRVRSKYVWERKLSYEELFSIFSHMAKYRGYKSISTEDLLYELEIELGFISDKDIEDSINDDENRKVYRALNSIEKLKKEYPELSISQIIDKAVKDGVFKSYRNHDNYEKMIRREDIRDEIKKMLLYQKEFGLFKLDEKEFQDFEDEIIDTIINQEDAKIDPNLFGKCAFLKDERVAPRYSYLYDIYKLYKSVRDLNISNHKVSIEDREKIYKFVEDKIVLGKNVKELKYKDIRKILSLQSDQKIFGLEDSIKLPKGKSSDRTLVKFHFISSISPYKNLIAKIKDDKDYLDIFKNIADILQETKSPKSSYKKIISLLDDKNINFDTRDEEVLNLIKKKSSGSLSISHKYILKALPYFHQGMSDSDIQKELGVVLEEDYSKFPKSLKYLHLGYDNLFEKYENKINNHAVKSLASWSLGIVCDLSYRYGIFDEIIVESARDTLPKKIKDSIEKSIKNRENELENIQKEYADTFPNLTKKDAKKIKLWKEQDCQDIFTGENIAISYLFSGEYDLNHILPQSLGGLWSDYNIFIASKNSNVTMNNRLPMDYLNEDQDYKNRVERLFEEGFINWKKRKNLLATSIEETFSEVRDTTGIRATSYLEALVVQNLKMFYPFSEQKRQKDGSSVRMIPGKTTSKARNMLSIKSKSRDTNFHHAEDALILATLSRGWQNRLHRMLKKNYGKSEEELKKVWEDITPHIEGVDIASFIKEMYEGFSFFGEDSLFYKSIDGSIKTVSYLVDKKPLSGSSHKDTLYSDRHDLPTLRKDILKEFASLKIIEDRLKFTRESFLEKYHKGIRDKLWVIRHKNSKDETILAIDDRAMLIADTIEKYVSKSKKDKSEDEEYKKKLGEILKTPIVVSNDKELRRVRFVYDKLKPIKIDRGLVETDKNFLGVLFKKSDKGHKLDIFRVDVNSRDKLDEEKGVMIAYLNELLYIFSKDKIIHSGCLRSFMVKKSGSKEIALFNPKFPANPSAQPKKFSTKNDKSNGKIKPVGIRSAFGVIKAKVDMTGVIKSYQKYGFISKELEMQFLKESGYGSLEECKDNKTV
jgi:CRISPR-associated endonuclease Csn1